MKSADGSIPSTGAGAARSGSSRRAPCRSRRRPGAIQLATSSQSAKTGRRAGSSGRPRLVVVAACPPIRSHPGAGGRGGGLRDRATSRARSSALTSSACPRRGPSAEPGVGQLVADDHSGSGAVAGRGLELLPAELGAAPARRDPGRPQARRRCGGAPPWPRGPRRRRPRPARPRRHPGPHALLGHQRRTRSEADPEADPLGRPAPEQLDEPVRSGRRRRWRTAGPPGHGRRTRTRSAVVVEPADEAGRDLCRSRARRGAPGPRRSVRGRRRRGDR